MPIDEAIESNLGIGHVQHRVGMEESRFDGGFLALWEVGYVMENLMDGMGAFHTVSTSCRIIFLSSSLTSR